MSQFPEIPHNSNVLGVGIDLVENQRIKDALERQGKAFEEKIFTPQEIAYCRSHRNYSLHFAVRFAAKEAISKAFGTGIGGDFGWKTASVENAEDGSPRVILDQAGQNLLQQFMARKVLISLSHTKDMSTAIALLIR